MRVLLDTHTFLWFVNDYISSLPSHHRDPFDRLLIAQSLVEQVPLISADVVFDRYSINRIW